MLIENVIRGLCDKVDSGYREEDLGGRLSVVRERNKGVSGGLRWGRRLIGMLGLGPAT